MQNKPSQTRSRRAGILLGAAVLVATLTGCAGAARAEPSPTPTPALHSQLEVLPGVAEVTGMDLDLTVVLATEATSEQVLATAEDAHALATDIGWPGELRVARVGPGVDPELDLTQPEPWSLPLYPGDIAVVLALLGDVLATEQIGGASVGVSTAWPTVEIDSIDEFSSIFDQISATELFADGGTYSLLGGERLQIVHVPARTSTEAVHEVIDISVDYPNAEVLLQATTEGPQWPELYIARVSAEEASAIHARLRSPALADADPEGYPLSFQISVIGPEGPVYTFGNFGDVPDGN